MPDAAAVEAEVIGVAGGARLTVLRVVGMPPGVDVDADEMDVEAFVRFAVAVAGVVYVQTTVFDEAMGGEWECWSAAGTTEEEARARVGSVCAVAVGFPWQGVVHRWRARAGWFVDADDDAGGGGGEAASAADEEFEAAWAAVSAFVPEAVERVMRWPGALAARKKDVAAVVDAAVPELGGWRSARRSAVDGRLSPADEAQREAWREVVGRVGARAEEEREARLAALHRDLDGAAAALARYEPFARAATKRTRTLAAAEFLADRIGFSDAAARDTLVERASAASPGADGLESSS